MAHEILTPEEFAVRLKIGRSTLFSWLGKGILTPDKHYIKVGRVLRFIWSDDTALSLLGLSSPAAKLLHPATKVTKPSKLKPFNWDY